MERSTADEGKGQLDLALKARCVRAFLLPTDTTKAPHLDPKVKVGRFRLEETSLGATRCGTLRRSRPGSYPAASR